MTRSARLALLLVLLVSARVEAEPTSQPAGLGPALEAPPPGSPQPLQPIAPQQLGIFLGGGYVGSPGLSGIVLASGIRYLPMKHLALSFDLGYGVEARNPDVQDRWWLIPSVAFTLPAGPVQLDLGVGLGLGATSGYTTFSAYVAAPFNPIWAFQLVPTVRAHAVAAMTLTKTVDLFARFDLATLVLGGTSIGSRVGDPHRPASDRIWYDFVVGVQFRIL